MRWRPIPINTIRSVVLVGDEVGLWIMKDIGARRVTGPPEKPRSGLLAGHKNMIAGAGLQHAINCLHSSITPRPTLFPQIQLGLEDSINDPNMRPALLHTGGAAAIPWHSIAVVALLATLQDFVSAGWKATGGEAAVVVIHIAVVALLAGCFIDVQITALHERTVVVAQLRLLTVVAAFSLGQVCFPVAARGRACCAAGVTGAARRRARPARAARIAASRVRSRDIGACARAVATAVLIADLKSRVPARAGTDDAGPGRAGAGLARGRSVRRIAGARRARAGLVRRRERGVVAGRDEEAGREGEAHGRMVEPGAQAHNCTTAQGRREFRVGSQGTP